VRYDKRTRRQFLRGLGGVSLALPLLPSLLPREVAAQGISAPIRYLQIIDHYGAAIGAWHINPSGVAQSQQKTENPIEVANLQQTDGVYHYKLSDVQGPLSATFGSEFDAFRDKMSIIQGMDCLDMYWNGKDRLDSHSPSIPTCAAGYKKEIENNTQKNLNFAYSIDAVLAESSVVYPTPAPIDQLVVAPFHKLADPYYEFGSFTWTSKGGGEQRVPAERDMKNVYDRLMEQVMPQAQPDMTGPSRRKLATDLVLEEYRAAMNGRRIAAADRVRLDNYMTFLSEAGRRLGLPGPAPVDCGSVQAPPALATGEEYERSAADMLVAALACGATRVASWSIMHHRSDANYSTVDDHAAGHESSHLPGGEQANHNRFVSQLFADALAKLDAIEEADGRTLLDNTIVYFANEDSLGGHTHYEMPIVLAGGGGKLRMGYHMDFRPRPLKRAEFNVSAGTFQQHLGRPVNSLLVTMMQAMGLAPADYQKFGKTGFGEYDRHHADHAAHYAPFKTDTAKNQPLPFLYL
jgi:hypothetical protein